MQIWFQCKAPWKVNKLLESGAKPSVLKLLTAGREFRLGMLKEMEGKKRTKERLTEEAILYMFSHQLLKGALGHNFF